MGMLYHIITLHLIVVLSFGTSWEHFLSHREIDKCLYLISPFIVHSLFFVLEHTLHMFVGYFLYGKLPSVCSPCKVFLVWEIGFSL